MINQPHPFTSELINWFSKAKRDLPWRQTKDPYKIWLSEIILQQTRVEQGLPYYNSFVENYPTVFDLANAAEDEVLRIWQGLGYYSRARNLHYTAKHIANDLSGVFPESYKEIVNLKGVGPYTAAAIASIAYSEPTPVLDGNVFRFASRMFGIHEDIMKNTSRKSFLAVLNELIDVERPGDFNQAMMEYGATICTPSPKCEKCLFTQSCYAFQHKKQGELPVKIKKLKIKTRFLQYFIIGNEHKILMRKRTESIWQGLYEYFLVETEKDEFQMPDFLITMNNPPNFVFETKHLLTHQKLWIKFYEVSNIDENQLVKIAKENDFEVIERKEVLNLPKPKPIVNFLEQTVQ